MEEPYFWEVEPKAIKVSHQLGGVVIPLSVRGNPKGQLQAESAQPQIARVSGCRLLCGEQVGATMVMVYDSEDRDSVRYIQVEVLEGDRGSGYQGGDNPHDWGI